MAKKKITLSIAIAVYNEEKNLERCLASVQPIADEIVVVDGGSTDKTVEIAKKFTSKIIRTDNPPMFHINKQKALDACTGEWILQIDADETIPEELREEILAVMKGPYEINGYNIPRKNYFWGHWMRKGGQYPDYVIRLVRRGKARFPAKTVHEQIEVTGKVGYLTHPMEHLSYKTTGDYWRKADAYTTLTAMEMKNNGVARNMWTWFTYNSIKPTLTLLSLFIRHKGFMDGWFGLMFAYFSALHFPIAYKKFRQLCQPEADRPLSKKKLLIICLLFALCFFLAPLAHADYVLPYPSYMPGNRLYTISKIVEWLESWWYWGAIGQTKYQMMLGDKYLVEAKTLFEYKQYELAINALRSSDEHIAQVPKYIALGKTQGKDMTQFELLFTAERAVHQDVLSRLKAELPKTFIWTPEKAAPTTLDIDGLLSRAIILRREH